MAKKKIPDLVVERAEDTGNLFYLSVIEYRKENYLVIVDNINEEELGAYVLDLAAQEGINLKELMSIVTRWFYGKSHNHPLSFEFSRLGLTHLTNKIYKTFELAHVTRLIGNDFTYNIFDSPKVKRRRVTMIPAGVEVKLKKS